jgi:nicotinamidase-related amidase
MDIQNGVVERFTDQLGSVPSTLAETVMAARAAGIPVIYVRVAFRAGAPE